MAARALQSLTITFGLVTIPVKIYAATNPNAGISFNLLHTCGSRVRQQYHCVAEDKAVPRDELIKGYEFEKDQFVTFTKDELEALDQDASGAVEITEFVDATSIDPVYYEKAYYLGPDKGGAKPYALLCEAMRRSGRTAIGRWAARGKQHLVQLRVTDEGLVMQQLLYAAEVRNLGELEIDAVAVNARELALAEQLITSITSEEGFDAAKYTDDVQARIAAQVQRKIEGKEITAPQAPVTPEGAQVIDLVEALRASLRGNAARPALKKNPARHAAAQAAQPAASQAADASPQRSKALPTAKSKPVVPRRPASKPVLKSLPDGAQKASPKARKAA